MSMPVYLQARLLSARNSGMRCIGCLGQLYRRLEIGIATLITQVTACRADGRERIGADGVEPELRRHPLRLRARLD